MEYLVSVSLAALAGGLVGLEREYRDKSAGFRTMILIAVGSCLFTILSGIIGEAYSGDGARVAAAVVSGVGFLGAGVIIQKGVTIHGLTTAASIWLVASLGMGMGVGEYSLVFMVTFGVLVVLWFLPTFERKIDALHEFFEFSIYFFIKFRIFLSMTQEIHSFRCIPPIISSCIKSLILGKFL